MTEKDLSQFGLLDEFSITELEQRLEFEAWCDLFCTSNDHCTDPNSQCPPINGACGGGGGETPPPDTDCIVDVLP